MFYLYVIECDDGSYYIGTTNNLLGRYINHCAGTGSAHCKKHKPVRIAQAWLIREKRMAADSIEYHFKRFGKDKKEYYIANPKELKFLLEKFYHECVDISPVDLNVILSN